MRGYARVGWGSWVSSQVQSESGRTFTAAPGTGENGLVHAPGTLARGATSGGGGWTAVLREIREGTDGFGWSLVSAPLLWQSAAHTLSPHSAFSAALPLCLNPRLLHTFYTQQHPPPPPLSPHLLSFTRARSCTPVAVAPSTHSINITMITSMEWNSSPGKLIFEALLKKINSRVLRESIIHHVTYPTCACRQEKKSQK